MDNRQRDRRGRRGVRHRLKARPPRPVRAPGAAALAPGLLAIAAVLTTTAPAPAGDWRPVSAVNGVSGPEGPRPYEMDRAGRVQDVGAPLVDFEELRGWSVLCGAGVTASLQRSREQRLFGDTTNSFLLRSSSLVRAGEWIRSRDSRPDSTPDPDASRSPRGRRPSFRYSLRVGVPLSLLAEKHVLSGKWEPLTARIPRMSRPFRLRLMADCGPAGSPDSDRAAWADVRLRSVDARPALRLR